MCSLRRLAKAIESLQCFSLAADPSFRHLHADSSKEVQLIRGLEFIRGRPFCSRDPPPWVNMCDLTVSLRVPQRRSPP